MGFNIISLLAGNLLVSDQYTSNSLAFHQYAMVEQ